MLTYLFVDLYVFYKISKQSKDSLHLPFLEDIIYADNPRFLIFLQISALFSDQPPSAFVSEIYIYIYTLFYLLCSACSLTILILQHLFVCFICCSLQFDCKVTSREGLTFDLSALRLSEGYHTATSSIKSSNVNFRYYINICRPLNPTSGKFCPAGAAVCREDSNGNFIVRHIYSYF